MPKTKFVIWHRYLAYIIAALSGLLMHQLAAHVEIPTPIRTDKRISIRPNLCIPKYKLFQLKI
jgi:hypothetical protein